MATTGYTVAELARIEDTFENCYHADYRQSSKQDVLKGLQAVFSVLKEIHEITDKDFSVISETVQNNLSDAIVERLVNRHESLRAITPFFRTGNKKANALSFISALAEPCPVLSEPAS